MLRVRRRLIEPKHIDAPEEAQSFGDKARQALRDRIAGRTVRVVSDSQDKYGRTLADVYDGSEWIDQWLIVEGWAWHYKRFSDDQTLAQAEVVARTERRGLWADNGVPVAPWDWRNPPDLPGLWVQGNGGKCPNLDSRRRQVEADEIERRGLEPCKVCKPSS
jgi:endonuclease YncB( thermonuclease family)